MSRFITDLDTRLVDEEADRHRLLAPLAYYSDLLLDLVYVPEGTETDFASVPRLPLAYLMVGGRGKRAAVLHDHLYSTGMVPRDVADEVFAEALKSCGYNAFVVSLMYAGVRMGGWIAWNKHRQAA
jgi:hypothetical protein